MIVNQKIPNLRFPEFEGEWEMKKLGEVMNFKVTNSFSRENLNYEKGVVKNIHYGDIHTKFQTLFDITKESVPFVNEEISIGRISEENYCKEGDIIFADASEDINDVGKSIEIKNLNGERLLSGLHTLLGRPMDSKFIIGFNGYLFKSNNIRLQIQKESQGSKVLSINVGRILGINLSFPSLPEQTKIASFLTAVDDKLQALKQKLTLLEQYKKGVMQKIFAQELRFKPSPIEALEMGDEYPDWEFVGGNELFDNISDKKHNSDLPILAITQDQGAIPRELINYEMSVTEASIASYKVVHVGDFIISLRTFQGGIEYSNYLGICSPAYNILRPNSENVDRTFYKFYLKTSYYIKQLQKNLEGIRDGKMISYKYFSEIKLPFPSKPEQQKIATFLSAIDEKIEKTTQQLTQTETFKKGLLQQLFV
jgi:type I restriction enzyme S subunit